MYFCIVILTLFVCFLVRCRFYIHSVLHTLSALSVPTRQSNYEIGEGSFKVIYNCRDGETETQSVTASVGVLVAQAWLLALAYGDSWSFHVLIYDQASLTASLLS